MGKLLINYRRIRKKLNPPKYIAGMKAKPPYTSSCYGYIYLLHHKRCPVRCDLRPMCKTKSKINERDE